MFNVVCRSVGIETDVQLRGIMQGSVYGALNNKHDSKHLTNVMLKNLNPLIQQQGTLSTQCGKQLIPYQKGLFLSLL